MSKNNKKVHPKRLVKLIFLIIPIILSIWIFTSVEWGAKKTNSYTTVFVPPGKNSTQIGVILKEKKVINSVIFFKLYVSYLGVSDKLVAGEYRIRKNSGLKETIDTLSKGPLAQSIWITLPEGIVASKIAEKIDGKGRMTADEFMRLIKKPATFNYPNIEAGITSLEGYLFPNTYRVFSNTTTEHFMNMLLAEFNAKVSTLDWNYAKSKNLTKNDIIIMASLIEREAKLPGERPIIAAVIYNRLAKGMPLQIDATIQYALPSRKSALTYRDLKIDSLYNTYTNKGLPPGAICSPGIDSIKAALSPTKVDYLYYVLVNRNNGRHAFANNYAEFLRLKKLRP